MSLTKQIQDLTDELTSSRAYIDNLLGSKGENERSGCEKREEEYKQTIRKLKTYVRQGENMISVALYQKAVNEARTRAKDCEACHREIDDLTSTVEKLENKLKEKASTSQVAPSSYVGKLIPSKGSSCAQQSRHACPKAWVDDRGNFFERKDSIVPSVKNPSKNTGFQPRPTGHVASRKDNFEARRAKKNEPRKVTPVGNERNAIVSTSVEKVDTVEPNLSCHKENARPKIMNKTPPVNATNTFDPIACARAAGGRAGLRAKLKKLRPSSVSHQNTKVLRAKNYR